jgi:hypothetical protein
MDLQRQRQAMRHVKQLLGVHGRDLGTIRGFYDLSTQEVGGYWEDPNTDFLIIDPSVRSGHIRQMTAGRVAKRGTEDPVLHTLLLKVVSFAGLHLHAPTGERIRVRKRPIDQKTGKPMRAPSAEFTAEPLFGDDLASLGENGTLFGYDPDAQPYEISMLVDLDLATKTLKGAVLAAIDWGQDDRGREIYYEEEIPATPMEGFDGAVGVAPPPSAGGWGGGSETGFEDLLQDEGEETGPDPA